MSILNDRLNGYNQALTDNNLNFQEDWLVIDERLQNRKVEGGYSVFKELLDKDIHPEAVLGVADTVIYGAMKAAYDFGFKIPEDISFMGNNDIYLSEYLMPALTTIKWPKKEMGRIAIKLLIDLINGKRIKEKKIILKTEIIERATVKYRD